MQASSPFDQAMARPLLDEPTRKKWRIGKQASSWFEKTAAMAVILAANDDDEDEDDDSETISFLSKDKSPVVSSSTTSNMESNITDLAFSLDSISSYNNDNDNNNKSGKRLFLRSTQQHPLEVPAPHEVWNSSCTSSTTSSSSHPLALELVQVDLECADTDLEILRERQAELTTIHSDMQQIHSIQHGKKQCYRISFSKYHAANNASFLPSWIIVDLAGLVDSHQSDVDRLSWNAIQAFDHAESGLEHVIQAAGYQQDRKSKLYSLMASTAIVLAVCYVMAGFFSPPDEDAAAVPGSNEQGSPKFLIRYFNP
jgi:hypothetical protein